MTPLDNAILDFIDAYRDRHGYSPTVREIGTQLGIKSPATTYKYLEILERKNLVRWHARRSRTLQTTRAELCG